MRYLCWLGLLLTVSVWAADRNEKIGEPGKFDYYLMAMSWSPAYCAGAGARGGNDVQCAPGRQFSFVLHGLWPQYEQRTNGSMWPQYCSSDQGLRDPKAMLDIMPSLSLIRHEWTRHGTCSGLGAESYFSTARRALGGVKIPARFVGPKEYMVMSPGEVKKEFLAANPGIPAAGIAISCSSNFLSEVRICLDRNLKPIPCSGERECKAQTVRIPPVR